MTDADIQALDVKSAGSDAFGLSNYDKLKSDIDLLLDVRRGWFGIADACTYSSVDGHTYVMTIAGDYTGVLGIGDWVKVTQSAVIRYFKVSATPTVSVGVTTVTMYGGTDQVLANSAISSPSFSHSKTPFGVNPDATKWTELLTDTSDRAQASPASGTWYNPGSLSLAIPIGQWRVSYGVLLWSNCNAGTNTGEATLSTANNSESDPEFTSGYKHGINGAFGSWMYREKPIVLAVKTTYSLNAKAVATGTIPSSIDFYGDVAKTAIRAVSALL